MGYHFLLQGIFLTQGSNLGLVHCTQTLYPLSHQGSPEKCMALLILTISVCSQTSKISLCLLQEPQSWPSAEVDAKAGRVTCWLPGILRIIIELLSSTLPPLQSLTSRYTLFGSVQFSSVAQLCQILCDPMDRPPCPSPTPGGYSDSCPSSQWCHPTISSSVAPFSSCPQSFPESGSFLMRQLFTSGGQSIGVSASTSVPPMNTQDWYPLG